MTLITPLLETVVVFGLAATVNSVSVYLQKHYKIYNRLGRWGIWLHGLIILPLWFWFMYLSSKLHGTPLQVPATLHFIGYLLTATATALFLISVVQLGPQSLVNGNFFGHGKWAEGRLFRYLRNPMYDSFILVFIGLALLRSQWGYFVLASASYIGLNLVQSFIERTGSHFDIDTNKKIK